MALDTFGGGEVAGWLDRYSLNPDIEWLLLDLGVEVVDDLDTLFESTDDLLPKARKALGATEYQHMFCAYKHFQGNSRLDDRDEEPYANDNSSWAVVSCANPDYSKENLIASQLTDKKEFKKERRISELVHRLKKTETLDLAILLDCTGSMQLLITTAKDKICALVASIREVHAGVSLRVAFIGYRDLCDGIHHMVVLPFTASIKYFKQKLSETKAFGGGNPLTDLIGALRAAENLNWTSSNRIMYHIGDYPCHGAEFHCNLRDMHPQGDPGGKHPITSLKRLAELKVKYYFGKLTEHTDKMIARFNELMEMEYVKTTPLNSTNMMDVITLNLTTVLTSTLSTSSSTENATPDKEREFQIDPTLPDWSAVPTEKAIVYKLTSVADMESLAPGNALGGKTIEDFPELQPFTFKCASHPFAKGHTKLAFLAQQQLIEAKIDAADALTHAKVLKESLSASGSHQTKEKFEEMVSCQRASAFLAQEFNKVRPTGCAAIEFAPVRLVQFLARPGRPYFIEEDQIPGEWERYSNNTGWCAPCPTPHGTPHQAVQAFSHWTHHSTGGKLMVTDCQGSYNAKYNAFLLTDPAIHCAALLSYGGTNMGEKGIERFFATHQCNHVCLAMGLSQDTVKNG